MHVRQQGGTPVRIGLKGLLAWHRQKQLDEAMWYQRDNMFVLNADRLVPGDILFTRHKTSGTSWSVRVGTFFRFSHAILYVDYQSYIDSDGDGVHANNLQRLLFSRESDVAVKRLKEPLPTTQMRALCDFARSEVGKRYSVPAAMGSIRGIRAGNLTGAKRQFCSRLVAMAYASVGADLVKNPMFSSPRRVFKSPKLTLVTDVCQIASPEHIEQCNRGPNALSAQEEITNTLLESVRTRTGSEVSTIGELVRLVVERPEVDSIVSSLLTSSGYLVMWMQIREQNPWWYDSAAFAQTFTPEERTNVADRMFDSISDSVRRHRENNAYLLDAFSTYRRTAIALMQQLESKLYELESERAAVIEPFRSKTS
jgi:hypothetical protein